MVSPKCFSDGPRPGLAGRLAVLAMVGLGATLAIFGIVYQRGQTVRCLRFFGPAAARSVTEAGYVELLELKPGSREGRLVAARRWDVSAARGLVHLRRGLVEDANYDWTRRGRANGFDDGSGAGHGGRLPAVAWTWGIAFAESRSGLEAGRATILIFATPGPALAASDRRSSVGGSMAVVGAAGRVGLGRIERGISAWIDGVVSASQGNERQVWEESASEARPNRAAR